MNDIAVTTDLAKLLSDLSRLRDDMYTNHCEINAVMIGDAIGCIEALQKDAQRYRWLRVQDWDSGELAVVRDPKTAVKLGHDCPSRDRLDAAIDSAASPKRTELFMDDLSGKELSAGF